MGLNAGIEELSLLIQRSLNDNIKIADFSLYL
jgi:hypothetical protein